MEKFDRYRIIKISFFLIHTSTAKNFDFQLQLSVSGISKVNLVPKYTDAYGDSSRELFKMLHNLRDLEGANYKIFSITALLICAILQAGVVCHWQDHDTLEVLTNIIVGHG